MLTEVPANLFDQPECQAFETALAEFEQAQHAMADRPGAHLNLGVMHANLGQTRLAEASYQTAIQMDDSFIPARFNLANLYNLLGRNQEAEQQFRQIIQRSPENGEAYYSLGLLLAELKRLDEAVDYLARAAELMPDWARVDYNHALALQHLGRRAEAEAAMLKAHQIDPRDPGIVHALAVFYLQQRQWERALSYAQKLMELAPGAPGTHQLMQRIQEELLFDGGSR